MGARLTLERVEQCLQQGKMAAQRLGVQAAIVVGKGAVPIVMDGTVVGAVGVSGGIPADLDHAIAEAAIRAG